MSAHHALNHRARLRPLTRALAAGALATGLLTGLAAPQTTTAPAAAATGDPRSAAAVYYALSELGTPYRWGGTGQGGYDCSGLAMAAYRFAGITIPRTSREQYARLPHVPIGKAHVGDLLFWASDTARPATVYHVAVYLGGGMMVSAPRTGTVVQVRKVNLPHLMPYAARPGGAAAADPLPVLRGSHGDDVRAVQRRLRANGYAAVRVTGAYDPATYAGIAGVQRAAGLAANGGTVGARTWIWLVRHGQTQHVG